MSNEEARLKTGWITEMPGYKSAFAKTKAKGKFLSNYTPTVFEANSTLSILQDASFELAMNN